MNIPKSMDLQFHEPCMSCRALSAIVFKETKYNIRSPQREHSTITCEHYDSCKALLEAQSKEDKEPCA